MHVVFSVQGTLVMVQHLKQQIFMGFMNAPKSTQDFILPSRI